MNLEKIAVWLSGLKVLFLMSIDKVLQQQSFQIPYYYEQKKIILFIGVSFWRVINTNYDKIIWANIPTRIKT